MSRLNRRGAAAVAVAAIVPTLAACATERATGAAPAPSSTAPVPVVTLTPRPPGEPTYHPDPHYVGPNPVNASARVAVTPYHGLTIGSRFTVVLTLTNPGRTVVKGLKPRIGFGEQVIVRVVDAGGGKVQKIDNHDPATNSKYPYFARAVDYGTKNIKPGTTKLKVVLEVLDMYCPGGGDFITEVSGAIGHVVKRGLSTGGRHLVWIENDATDYARVRATQGASNTAPPHAVCRAESVE